MRKLDDNQPCSSPRCGSGGAQPPAGILRLCRDGTSTAAGWKHVHAMGTSQHWLGKLVSTMGNIHRFRRLWPRQEENPGAFGGDLRKHGEKNLHLRIHFHLSFLTNPAKTRGQFLSRLLCCRGCCKAVRDAESKVGVNHEDFRWSTQPSINESAIRHTMLLHDAEFAHAV